MACITTIMKIKALDLAGYLSTFKSLCDYSIDTKFISSLDKCIILYLINLKTFISIEYPDNLYMYAIFIMKSVCVHLIH